MASLLPGLLLDTRERSEHLLEEFRDLKGRLPADIEPFRKRWARLVQRSRAAIDRLLSDPDLGNPLLAGNFYISYKAITQFLFEVEAAPLIALSRFRDSDLFVTRTVALVCKETGYPDAAPLGSAGSTQFYGALPEMDLVVIPSLEPSHLLGLADLYHELAHFVLRRNAATLVAPFRSVIDRVYDELFADARRRNATPPELAALQEKRTLWKRGWYEEFASDMIATFWAGPCFGWANVRLCTNMSSALFTGGQTHPADAARHRGVDLMLRGLGCSRQAEEIQSWWDELVSLSADAEPHDFELDYPPKLLEQLRDFLLDECPKLGLVAWPRQDTSSNPHIGRLLNEAWDEFRSAPETFGSFERTAVERLRRDLGLT